MPPSPAPPEPNAENDAIIHDDVIAHDGPGTNPSIGFWGSGGGAYQLVYLILGSEVKFRRWLSVCLLRRYHQHVLLEIPTRDQIMLVQWNSAP